MSQAGIIVAGSSGGVTPVSGGGTGDSTLTAHGVLIGEGTSPVHVTSAGTVGQALISGGASADPAFGTTPVAGGGTGATTLTAHGVLLGEGTSAVAATSAGTSGQVLISGGASADSSFGALGVNSGLTAHGVILGEGNLALAATSAGTVGQALISGGASANPAFGTTPVAGGGTGAVTLTAHGVLLGEGTSAVAATSAGTVGQALISGGASADPAFGTTPVAGGGTGATTLTGVLTGNGASAVTANAVTNHSLLLGGASNAVTSLGTAINGQIAIGSTGGDPVLATLTPGSGITITNAAGSITIAASGGGSGDVVGPSSAIDNNICRFDGTTGKIIQSSGVQISDAGDLVANADLIGQNLQAQGYLTIESIGNYSGIVTLSSGTASVTGSFFSGNPVCFPSCIALSGTPGVLVATLSGGNFTITSYDSSGNVQTSDNSDVGYIIVRTQ